MSELVSAYPTAGGIYWWASKLGGPAWGWFTGWFNLIGLIAVTASVDYGCATFLNTTLGALQASNSFNGSASARRRSCTGRSCCSCVILALHAVINIVGSHLVARINGDLRSGGTSLGVAVIVGVLIFVPDHHASVDFVFTERFNNSGFTAAQACTGSTCCRSASC